ncbi:nucleoside transporter-domain-containing protein [Entophlyctis helioformis]|nr:nucleoside transporter-domain-containing protein [Entophlyctis helioformis]
MATARARVARAATTPPRHGRSATADTDTDTDTDTHAAPADSDGQSEQLLRAGAATLMQQAALLLMFALFGVAMLSPWNTWITAASYFKARLAGSAFASNFQSYFSLAFMATSLSTLLHARQDWLVVSSVVFTIAAAMPQMDMSATAYFGCSLVLIVVSGVSSALLGGFIGFAAAYPAMFVTAIVSGQGLAGVVPAVIQLLLLLSVGKSGPDQESVPAAKSVADGIAGIMIAYFSVSVVISLASLAGFIYLSRPASRHWGRDHSSTGDEGHGLLESDPQEPDSARASLAVHIEEDGPPPSTAGINALLTAPQTSSTSMQSLTAAPPQAQLSAPLAVIRTLRPHILAMVINFAITLAIFPAITSSIVSTLPAPSRPSGQPDLFIPMHFIVLNIADFVGKSLPMVPSLSRFSPRALLSASIARVVFIPLFLFCNVVITDQAGTPLPRTLPLLFPDAVYMALLALLGASGGWIGTLLFIAAPASMAKSHSHVQDAREPDTRATSLRLAGDVMVVALSCGLVSGSGLSFLLRWMLCGCNPFVS